MPEVQCCTVISQQGRNGTKSVGVGLGCEVGEFGVCKRHHEGWEWVGEGPGLGWGVG